MGMIRIETSGSFGSRGESFGPANHGHVITVAEAIEWLSSELLPEAHALDHVLHEQGSTPPLGWRKQ